MRMFHQLKKSIFRIFLWKKIPHIFKIGTKVDTYAFWVFKSEKIGSFESKIGIFPDENFYF